MRDALSDARKLFAGECKFVAGAGTATSIPPSPLPEIAFFCRSNVGKISLINSLVGNAKPSRVLAKARPTPQINFYRLGERLMLADLPGYGFARAPRGEQARWGALITDYLHTRPNLRRVMLLIDARRGVMELDKEVMTIFDRATVSYQLVLTKT